MASWESQLHSIIITHSKRAKNTLRVHGAPVNRLMCGWLYLPMRCEARQEGTSLHEHFISDDDDETPLPSTSINPHFINVFIFFCKHPASISPSATRSGETRNIAARFRTKHSTVPSWPPSPLHRLAHVQETSLPFPAHTISNLRESRLTANTLRRHLLRSRLLRLDLLDTRDTGARSERRKRSSPGLKV